MINSAAQSSVQEASPFPPAKGIGIGGSEGNQAMGRKDCQPPQLDLPVITNSNFFGWIFHTEQYFLVNGTVEQDKVP